MPFLQFLSGARDQDFDELNAAASLVVGSGAEAHIRCGDPGIEAKHCTVYPAQGKFWLQDVGTGSTVLNMKRLQNATEGLTSGDVFILGTTYVKYWDEKPGGGGGGGDDGGGGGGADPAQLQQAEADLKAAKADLGAAQAELEALKAAGSGQGDQIEALESSLSKAEAQAEESANALEATKSSLEEAQGKVAQLETDLSAATADAQAAIEKAKADADSAGAELESALEASRTALAAFEGRAAASGHDSIAAARDPSDLEQALAALALPDALAQRLKSAVASEVDREVLRRLDGPVVPLSGFRVPGCERDLESEIRAVRLRGEQVAAAREIALADLDQEEVERLLALARG